MLCAVGQANKRGEALSTVSNWAKAHTWVAIVIAFLLGITIAAASASPDGEEATSRSSSARIDGLEQDVADAESLSDDLAAENERLQEELSDALGNLNLVRGKLSILKSRRPIQDLAGMSRAALHRLADRLGWRITFKRQISSAAVGTVISQSPAPGTVVQEGSAVIVVIAKAPPPPDPAPVVEDDSSSSGGGCTPGYDPCLPPASDYDCSGGTGDGPEYTGYVTVSGADPYGLDADGDGVGCE